jgi:hypothetical protein
VGGPWGTSVVHRAWTRGSDPRLGRARPEVVAAPGVVVDVAAVAAEGRGEGDDEEEGQDEEEKFHGRKSAPIEMQSPVAEKPRSIDFLPTL